MLDAMGQVVMHPAGEMGRGGADDQLVDLLAGGDGAAHGVEGILPGGHARHVGARGAPHHLQRRFLAPIGVVPVIGRDEQREGRSRAWRARRSRGAASASRPCDSRSRGSAAPLPSTCGTSTQRLRAGIPAGARMHASRRCARAPAGRHAIRVIGVG